MENKLITDVRKSLKEQSNKAIAESSQKFFKEEIKFYGLSSSSVRQISKGFLKQMKGLGKEEIFNLCEELWKSEYLEEKAIACEWSYSFHKSYSKEDFYVFENWVKKYVNNWASCDTLCNHNVGDIVMMYPELVKELKTWAVSDNRWVKRASAVSLIIPARKGLFLKDIFEISDILLKDEDDMVQKGYGWVLKAASEAYQKEVFEYVMKNKHLMPRTSLRYAIEKMPKELKAQAMAK